VVYTGDGAWGIEKPRQIRSSNRPFYLEKLSSKRHFIMVVLDKDSEHFFAIDDEGNKIDEWGLKLHSKLDAELDSKSNSDSAQIVAPLDRQ
jgi:hypothetical protein